MPFAKVIETGTVIPRTREKSLKLFFVLRRVPHEFRDRTATLLARCLNDFECVATNVFREQNATRLALSAFAELLDNRFGDASWEQYLHSDSPQSTQPDVRFPFVYLHR